MKQPLLILIALIASMPLMGQPFTVHIAPDTVRYVTSPSTFTVRVAADSGFRATVFLSADSPTLPYAEVTIAPSYVNPPFDDSAVVTVTLTGPKVAGVHPIVVTARNGAVTIADSAWLSVAEKPAWRVYTRANSPLPSDLITCITLEPDGTAWIGTSEGLARLEDTTWTIFDDDDWGQGYGSARLIVFDVVLDSMGGICVLLSGRLLTYRNGQWRDVPDTSWGWWGQRALATDTAGVVYRTRGNGLSRLRDTVWTTVASEDEVGRTGTIAVGADNALWVGTNNGIMKFDGSYWRLFPLKPQIMTPFRLPDGGMGFLGGYYAALIRGDSVREIGYRLFKQFPGDGAVAAEFDAAGDAWVVHTDNPEGLGLVRYDSTLTYPKDTFNVSNSGLPWTFGTCLAIRGTDIWVGTKNGLAILDATQSGYTIRSDAGAETALTNTLAIELAGNPVRSAVRARVSSPARQAARIALVDLCGREVLELFDGMLKTGVNEVALDCSGATPGVYFLRVAGAEGVVSRKVIVAR